MDTQHLKSFADELMKLSVALAGTVSGAKELIAARGMHLPKMRTFTGSGTPTAISAREAGRGLGDRLKQIMQEHAATNEAAAAVGAYRPKPSFTHSAGTVVPT